MKPESETRTRFIGTITVNHLDEKKLTKMIGFAEALANTPMRHLLKRDK